MKLEVPAIIGLEQFLAKRKQNLVKMAEEFIEEVERVVKN